MINRTIETYPTHTVFITADQNQLFLTASISARQADPRQSVKELYTRIAQVVSADSFHIVHERCFGKIEFQAEMLEIRKQAFETFALETETPITYVEGESCAGNAFAGIQLRALRPLPGMEIRTIVDSGIPKGRMWNLNGSTFFMLQGIDGGKTTEPADRKSRSEAMFSDAERLLRAEGASYQDVVRTWIYLSDILDWYGDFNTIRNRQYSDFGFLRDTAVQAEQIFLPASTGIEGKNPSGLPATMDVFAIHRTTHSATVVRPVYGTKQRSPFRYGSAFSRAMVVEDAASKLILVSGTASIDEQGNSVYVGDAAAQIHQSLNVVAALAESEGAKLHDLCEVTVFLKNKEDFPVYRKAIEQLEIANIPSVNVVADVCRDELLFELDAVFLVAKEQ